MSELIHTAKKGLRLRMTREKREELEDENTFILYKMRI